MGIGALLGLVFGSIYIFVVFLYAYELLSWLNAPHHLWTLFWAQVIVFICVMIASLIEKIEEG